MDYTDEVLCSRRRGSDILQQSESHHQRAGDANGRRRGIAKYVAIAAVVGLAATVTGAGAATPPLRPHIYSLNYDVPPFEEVTDTQMCPRKRPNALGGGFELGSEPLEVELSLPVNGKYGRSVGWVATVSNPSDEERYASVKVVCGL